MSIARIGLVLMACVILGFGCWTPVEIWQRPDAMEISGKGAWNGTLLAYCEMGYWSCHVVYFEDRLDYTHTNPIPFVGLIPSVYQAYIDGWVRYDAYDRCKHAGEYRVASLVDSSACAGTRRKFWTFFGMKYEDEL